MGKSIVSLIERVSGFLVGAGIMVGAIGVKIIGRQAHEDRLRRRNAKMSETTLVYFKCPSCGEMSSFKRINKWMRSVGLRFIETECDTCHDTIRLRFISNVEVLRG